MAIKEDQFTEIKHFVIYTATWNVNGQNPNGPLTDWLAPTDEDPPDMYAIGFQELDLSKEAFVFNESPKEDVWRSVVSVGLNKKAKYKQVNLNYTFFMSTLDYAPLFLSIFPFFQYLLPFSLLSLNYIPFSLLSFSQLPTFLSFVFLTITYLSLFCIYLNYLPFSLFHSYLEPTSTEQQNVLMC